MSITITHPPELITDSTEFWNLKKGLRSEVFFNLGQNVVAYSDQYLKWTGQADSSKVGLPVDVYWGDGTTQSSQVLDGATDNIYVQSDGSYEFYYHLRRHVNKITVIIGGEQKTDYLSAYNWATLLTGWAPQYTEFSAAVKQVKRNRVLTSSAAELSTVNPDYRHVYRNWGASADMPKLPDDTVDDYISLLDKIYEAYERGDMYASFREPIEEIMASSIRIEPWYEKRFSHGDSSFRVRVDSPPSTTLLVNGGVYEINTSVYTLRQSTVNVSTNTVTYLYCDTTVGADGYAVVQTGATKPVSGIYYIAEITADETNVVYITGCQRPGIDALGVSHWARANNVDVILTSTVDSFELEAIGTIIFHNKDSDSMVFLYSNNDEIIGRY